MPYFDTHCHLNSKEYDEDRDSVISRAIDKKVKIIDVATDIESSIKALSINKIYSGQVYASVGFHPQESTAIEKIEDLMMDIEIEAKMNELEELIINEHPIAIGECGLDYYWLKVSQMFDRDALERIIRVQKRVFRLQAEYAKKYELPIIIHVRSVAEDSNRILSDTLKILKAEGNPQGVFHSYTGNYQDAKQFLSLGYYISFNGIVTFKKSDEMRNMMKKCFNEYQDQIILETDGPLLSPEGRRGERNEPANMDLIYANVGREVGYNVEKIVNTNVERLFGIG